ncbi:MAG TPA: hypothetical protein VN520_21040 [Streptomyces sp.]|nr:hypothetical protein [Streptomyces sp.]HWU08834.1 hypothetical protein [Streptomyces sp.]
MRSASWRTAGNFRPELPRTASSRKPWVGLQDGGDVGLHHPGELGLFGDDVAEEHRFQVDEPGVRLDDLLGHAAQAVLGVPRVAGDQRAYVLGRHGGEETLPVGVRVLVAAAVPELDAPGRGIGGCGQGRAVGELRKGKGGQAVELADTIDHSRPSMA